MELKGSKTEENLQKAFAGESMARNKYNYYSSQAKKEGYVQISNIFTETADNEKEHAKMWFKHLHGGAVPKTLENLADAAAGEHGEWAEMYAEMAEVAKSEGFLEIAEQMLGVAKVEKVHEERYLKLATNIKENSVFDKDKVVVWKCLNCGHIHIGKSAPDVCPVCDHPKAYFQILEENY